MMKISKNMIITMTIAFCFIASMFMVIPIRSQAPGQYDPWLDINDDGRMSMDEIVAATTAFGATGNPINKTELLIQVNATYAGLLSEIDSLNSSLLSLQAYLNMRITILEVMVGEQQVRIANLETELAQMNSTISQLSDSMDILNMTKLGKPDFDSLWCNITAGQQITFNHNLGTTNVLVYMIGNDTSGTLYIHQIKYGGDTAYPNEFGCRWQELTSTSIKVIRASNDPNWNKVRIMIWKIPT
jgi:uncharacterized coiled-coil protein SlyX